MTFERSWMLLLLLPVAGFVYSQWRPGRSKLQLACKALMLAAVIFAVSEPRISVDATKVAAAILVDTSGSIPDADLARASALVSDFDRARGRHSMTVIPFARNARALTASETRQGWSFANVSGEPGRGTNLEAAVRHAAASLPAGMVPRIVLLSDGNETEGNIARASSMARQLRVPIDTIPLGGRPAPKLRVEAASVPAVAFSGEKFPIVLTITAPGKTATVVTLSAEGKPLGQNQITLEAGANQVRLHTSVNVAGAVEISGLVKSPEYGDAPFRHAVTFRPPRMLFVSQDPPGTEEHLLRALSAAHFEVRHASELTGNLTDYQVLVLNNLNLQTLGQPQKQRIEQYVKQGGGLLVIGGEKNMYVEDKKGEDALDRVLPATLAPPKSPEGTCVVLIVDKSSSMEGRKMELARQSAIGVIMNLRPVDFVGVLIFDNSFQWAVPIRRAEDRSTIARLVAGITPDGGTQIAPALTEGFRKIQRSTATYRHVVLLTDGISEEGDSVNLAKEASGQKITISTVGLGQDVNRPYLEKIAVNAKGKSYFLTDPSGLEQILLKDVMEHTGSTAVEKPLIPIVAETSAILDGIDASTIPALKGYVKYIAKPEADRILNIDEKEPLLALWQSGLGRSAVFTSDAKSRWAEKWVGWPGFERFWINLMRDLLPHSQRGEATLTYDPAGESLVAEYKLAPHVPAPATIPDLFVFGANGFQQPLPIQKVGEGAWRGTLRIGDRQGLFRVRPLRESALFPETGFYREEEEMRRFGSNEALLKRLSAYTGGRFSPSPSQIFDAGGRSIATTMELWPGLLAAAILLNLAELLIRKWASIGEWFRARRAAA